MFIKASLAFLLSAAAVPLSIDDGEMSVLVFSKTAGYRHQAIEAGASALREMGAKEGFYVEHTEDSADFNEDNLSRFNVVVWLMTTGDVLNEAQQAAFERYIRSGKGYVGIHAASDTEFDWPWYGKLVGAYFKSHPPIQEATFVVEDRDHPATRMLPARWPRVDEHYNFSRNPRQSVQVLLSLDESTYDVGPDAMGDHPAAWCHAYDGGRAFYTALGHTEASYRDELFLAHLRGAIGWAAGETGQAPASRQAFRRSP